MVAATWRGKRVAITGHTGFKGAWLSYVLSRLGADVWGYALPPTTAPNLFEAIRISERIHSNFGDVRDRDGLERFFKKADPEVVFHLAAQPLVRRGYDEPIETFETNVMGTALCLELGLSLKNLAMMVVVTTDKCYSNNDQQQRIFVESDPLGGADPYSASKAAAEIVSASYRASYYEARGIQLATVRAGNVIGGGDWSPDRIFTDLVRAAFEEQSLVLRNPNSIRPWQHVLDALRGYLCLPERAQSGESVSESWNFAPQQRDQIKVHEIVDIFSSELGRTLDYDCTAAPAHHEAASLRLNAEKAQERLGWVPRLNVRDAVRYAVDWYRAYYAREEMEPLMDRQIAAVFE